MRRCTVFVNIIYTFNTHKTCHNTRGIPLLPSPHILTLSNLTLQQQTRTCALTARVAVFTRNAVGALVAQDCLFRRAFWRGEYGEMTIRQYLDEGGRFWQYLDGKTGGSNI